MSIVVSDLFTDTAGVSLDAHTPDVRPGTNMWTEHVGDWKIATTGNRVDLTAAINGAYATIDSGVYDGIVSASAAHDTGSTSVSRDVGVVVRFTSTGNFWLVSFNETASAFRITQFTSGTPTTRATTTVTITPGTFYTIEATLSGDTISATLNGANSISYGSASQGNTATVHGIYGRDIAPTCQVDWFEVDDGITGNAGVLNVTTDDATVAGTAVSPIKGWIGQQVTFGDGFGRTVNTAIDLLISAGWPTFNGGLHSSADLDPINPQSWLLRFNLSSIPSTATCLRATLHLFKDQGDEGGGVCAGNVFSVSSANGDWIEGTKDIALASAGEPCWNAKAADGAGGVTSAWAGQPGCRQSGVDYESTSLGAWSFAPSDPIGTEIVIPLDVSRISGWFGTSNTNYGIVLISNGTNNAHVGSSDSATNAYKPYLEVEYVAALPLDNATLAASAVSGSVISCSLAVTTDNATLSSEGETPAVASASITTADATVSATGSVLSVGQLAVTLDNATIASTGTAIASGSLSSVLDSATLQASAVSPIYGTLVKTLDNASLLGSLFSGSGATCVLVVTLEDAVAVGALGDAETEIAPMEKYLSPMRPFSSF